MEEATDYIHSFLTGLVVSRQPVETKEVYPCNYDKLSEKLMRITNDKNLSKRFCTLVKILKGDIIIVKKDSIERFREFLIENSLIHNINKVGNKKFFGKIRGEFMHVLSIVNDFLTHETTNGVEKYIYEGHAANEQIFNGDIPEEARNVYSTYILFWLFFNIKFYTNTTFTDIAAKILFFLFMGTGKNIIFKPSIIFDK